MQRKVGNDHWLDGATGPLRSMAGYLSHAAALGGQTGSSTAHRLRPFIRSRSPIAERDQRIGLSEWEAPLPTALGEVSVPDTAPEELGLLPASSTSAPEPSSTDRQTPPSNLVSRSELAPQLATIAVVRSRPSAEGIHPPLKQPEPQNQSESKLHLKPHASSANRSEPRIQHPTREDRIALRRQDVAWQPDSVAASISSAHASPAAFVDEEQPLHSEAKKEPAKSSKGSPVDLKRESAAIADEGPRNLPLARAESSMPEVAPGAIAVPRPVPVTIQRGEVSPAASPRVVIDRLEIEVVPPPPAMPPKPSEKSDRKSVAARPRRPVSQIGPLSPSTASRHYLSLRYR